MVDRKDVGSWLQGRDTTGDSPYAGARLGLPAEGAGSVARLSRRVPAIIIDWALCSLIAAAFFDYRLGGAGATSFAPLLVLAVENLLLVGTTGFTIGHRLMGVQVQRVDGVAAGPLAGLIRTVLLCLVIPAVVFDQDQRGLHDRAAGTVLINTR